MQQFSTAEPKSSSFVVSSPSFRWWYPWLPAEYDTHNMHEVQASYQRRVLRLMFAASVLYGSSAILLLPDDCQASFSFLPASRALSLAALLTQLAFYYGIPSQIPQALSFLKTEESRSRTVVFFASLWIPFVPFVLSIILLCCGTNHSACIP